MCLAVFSYKQDDEYPLIFASNRDEFYERPAQPATFWYDAPSVLAGRDLKAGGTWMGITKEYKFASLTNYRDLTNIKKNAPSRGDIVPEFLTSAKNAPDFLEDLKPRAGQYNGFNLIAGTIDDLWYFNNQDCEIVQVKPGIHTISNAFLNTPWPKTEKAQNLFTDVLSNGGADDSGIFGLLRDEERFPLHRLPSTGLSPEMEQVVSSIFISSENYGTRCSTIVKASRENTTRFVERTYNPESGEVDQIAKFRF
jgi:uncharacterized protein with NRDE domain